MPFPALVKKRLPVVSNNRALLNAFSIQSKGLNVKPMSETSGTIVTSQSKSYYVSGLNTLVSDADR